MKDEDFVSGNAYYGRTVRRDGIPQRQQIINVEVRTRRVDGLDFPAVVIWPDGREYPIDRVHGSRYDDELKALQYGVRIEKRNTFVWRRDDGTWFAVKR